MLCFVENTRKAMSTARRALALARLAHPVYNGDRPFVPAGNQAVLICS